MNAASLRIRSHWRCAVGCLAASDRQAVGAALVGSRDSALSRSHGEMRRCSVRDANARATNVDAFDRHRVRVPDDCGDVRDADCRERSRTIGAMVRAVESLRPTMHWTMPRAISARCICGDRVRIRQSGCESRGDDRCDWRATTSVRDECDRARSDISAASPKVSDVDAAAAIARIEIARSAYRATASQRRRLMPKVTVDGIEIEVPARRHRAAGVRAGGQGNPALLLSRAAEHRRQLPHVPGRGEARAAQAAGVAARCRPPTVRKSAPTARWSRRRAKG